MAELILTPDEEAAGSYLDWDDASLGRLVRQVAHHLTDQNGSTPTIVTAGAYCLIRAAVESGAGKIEFKLKNVTVREDVGDWRVTVKRIGG